MANCGQACPYNTLYGCKVKEHNAICPLTNMATPIAEYRMTNADRIRAMSDEELAEDYCKFLNAMLSKVVFKYKLDFELDMEKAKSIMLKYFQQPAEGECP